MTDLILSDEQARRLHAWRRRVVALWLATLVAALAVWAAVSAFATPIVVDAALAAVLIALTVLSAWTMRRGMCPRCGHPIRFQPRIELPRACSRCSVSFWPQPDEQHSDDQ